MLLELGVDLNARDRDGMCALSFAANSGSGHFVTLLVEKGADRDNREERGYTPLMLAVAGGHGDIVEYLLQKGVKTDVRGRGGVTARSLAMDRHDTKIVALLDRTAPKPNDAKTSDVPKPSAQATRPATP